jgi:hypothetical protein
MSKFATIIKIDLVDFNDTIQQMSPAESVAYLDKYYALVNETAGKFGWRIIKTMGDCVMLSAESKDSARVKSFFEKIQPEYRVSCQYRDCEYEESSLKYGDFQCLDVFGKDINNLFLHDKETGLLG